MFSQEAFEGGDGWCFFNAAVELIPDLRAQAHHIHAGAWKPMFFANYVMFVPCFIGVLGTANWDELAKSIVKTGGDLIHGASIIKVCLLFES